jgi:hypothetical protein
MAERYAAMMKKKLEEGGGGRFGGGGGGGGFGGSSSGRSDGCFKCGESGHFSRFFLQFYFIKKKLKSFLTSIKGIFQRKSRKLNSKCHQSQITFLYSMIMIMICWKMV